LAADLLKLPSSSVLHLALWRYCSITTILTPLKASKNYKVATDETHFISAARSSATFYEGLPTAPLHLWFSLRGARLGDGMSRQPTQNLTQMLDPEKENFVVHPERRGSQRTDADLLAVRFPHRAERLFDDPNDIMADDEQGLRLSHDWIDVVIAEVKDEPAMHP
jgi:hypothetical protein